MSHHYSSFLEITFFNSEDVDKFLMSLDAVRDAENQDIISFNTNYFFIDTSLGLVENVVGSVWIAGESHDRNIGGDNVRDFFNEIEEMGQNLGVEIKNIYLRFLSYEDDEEGYTIFVRNLEQEALNKFYQMKLIDEFDEDFDKTREEVIDFENELRDTYSKVPWLIRCGINELQTVIESDKEGRDTLLDFENEIAIWSRNIIEKWQFPDDEGCTMWAAALYEDGEFMWDNQ